MTVFFNTIIIGFEKIGINQKDKLIVHSSLSSFGHVEGGAETVIKALQFSVGKEGIILMPTFTYGDGIYDIQNSPSKTGYISEVFRHYPNVYRSMHPAFSVAVWGKNAKEIIDNHNNDVGIGKDTPIHKMINQSAKILLIGVDHIANSAIHLAQDIASVPYLERYRNVKILNIDGTTKEFRIRRAGCSKGFNKIVPILKKNNIEEQIEIGNSKVRIMNGQDIIELACNIFNEDPSFLLCDIKDCPSCREAYQMILQKDPN